jgi:hypothetical protein
MKLHYLSFFSLLIFNLADAQLGYIAQYNKKMAESWDGEYIHISQYKVKGTPYLLGEAFPGTVKYRGGGTNNGNILYNLLEQKAGIGYNNQIYDNGGVIEEFTMNLPKLYGGEVLLFKNTELFGNTDLKSYFNIIEDGAKVSFLKIFRIRLIPDPSNQMDKELRIFEQYFDYYLYVKGNKNLSKIKLKSKDVISQFGEEEFIKNQIKSADLDVSKEEDMIKLIRAINNN